MSPEKLYKVFSRNNILVITDERTNPWSLITDASGDLEIKLGPKATGEGGYLYYVPTSEMEAFEEYMRSYASKKR